MTFTIEPQSLVAQILGEMSSKEQIKFGAYNTCVIAVTAENITALLENISISLFDKSFDVLEYLEAEKSIRFFLLQVLQSINTPNGAREIYRSISGSIGGTLKIPPKGKQGIFLLVTAKGYKNKGMTRGRKIKNAKIILLIHILKMLGEKALKT